ncbi:MAG: DUF1232 domain-containing protein [Methylobacterium mesophilicum]|nr:DUF1232 domain-containing protein [Methylobacterium mesophilicum]
MAKIPNLPFRSKPVSREAFWRTVKRAVRHIPFTEEVVAAYYCALDRNTPLRAKGIIFGALAYFIMPADAIPDILFMVGFTDDLAVLTAAIAAVRAHITPAHRLAAKEALADNDVVVN